MEEETITCEICQKEFPLELAPEGKCGQCLLNNKRIEEQIEFQARLDDKSWDGINGEHCRAERDRKLVSCDWTQIADAPVDKEAWAVYRQLLRNIPETYATPADIIWPEPPQ